MKTYQQPEPKLTERFWIEISEKTEEKTQRKSWMDKQRKIIRRTHRRPESENAHGFTENEIYKIWSLKTPGHDGIHSVCFKKFTSILDSLALENNKCLQGAHGPEGMTKEKTTLIEKGPNKRTTPKQQQTHNLPADDAEKFSRTNKGRDFPLANKLQIVPWKTERMLQRI